MNWTMVALQIGQLQNELANWSMSFSQAIWKSTRNVLNNRQKKVTMNYGLKLKPCPTHPAYSCVFLTTKPKTFLKKNHCDASSFPLISTTVWGLKDWFRYSWWHHCVRHPSLESIWIPDVFIFDKRAKTKINKQQQQQKSSTNPEIY